jgi:phosphoglycolate phosphatase
LTDSKTGKSKIQALVFDWDGTIIDSTRLIVDSLLGASRDLGLAEPSRQQASSLIGLVLSEAARRLHPMMTDSQIPLFVERYRHYYFQKDASLQPFIGIPELLDELAIKPVWLAVATGKSRIGLMRALAELGWEDGSKKRFISLRCGDDGEPKPSPWMLNDLGAELGLKPEEMIMIGDTTHDLGMARAAGVKAVAVNYGAQPAEVLQRFIESARPEHAPVHFVSSVAQLRERLLAYLAP